MAAYYKPNGAPYVFEPQDCADGRQWTWEEDGYTVIRSHARTGPGCHSNCGVLLYVKDGRLEKVEGDRENPFNQGRLCPQCLAVKEPLIKSFFTSGWTKKVALYSCFLLIPQLFNQKICCKNIKSVFP